MGGCPNKSRGVEKLGLKTRAELVRYAAVQGELSDICPVAWLAHAPLAKADTEEERPI